MFDVIELFVLLEKEAGGNPPRIGMNIDMRKHLKKHIFLPS